MKPRAVILFSGGLDSTTCLAIAKSKGFDCYAISFHYGQRHAAELNAAKKIAAHYQVSQHWIYPIPTLEQSNSALIDKKLDIPDFVESDEVPITYVPARNTVFLAAALGWAEVLDARDIFYGANAVDYSKYCDCTPEYVDAFQKLAQHATQKGVEGEGATLHAPLIYLHKAEIIQLGTSLGVDYGMTVSCYQANEQGEACGRCDSCGYRKKGFKEAGIDDPTRYSSSTLATEPPIC